MENLQRRISSYDHVLEEKIPMLLIIDPFAFTAQFGINSIPVILTVCTCKLTKYKYISDRSVLDIATAHIGHRIGAATADVAPHGVPVPPAPC